MSDTISRQSAIDTVEFGITYAKAIDKSTGEVKELFKEGNKALNEAVERLKELPSVEPERKNGRWVKDNYGNTVCSECLGIRRDNRINYINFCNQCGADMRGDKDEDR